MKRKTGKGGRTVADKNIALLMKENMSRALDDYAKPCLEAMEAPDIKISITTVYAMLHRSYELACVQFVEKTCAGEN